jgi:hypothetical protein
MTRIKTILMTVGCLLFLGGSRAVAQGDGFDPANPGEPAPSNYCRVVVSADPAEAAYVSGGGKYTANGADIWISASANNYDSNYYYAFQYWTLNGERTSYGESFYFPSNKGKYTLVAHYKKVEIPFEPTNPAEPNATNVKRKYFLYLIPNIEGACSFNIASGNKIAEETQLYVEAYPNNGYQFEGWKLNGKTVSTSQWYWFTMPSANTTLEACFSEIPFDPENPVEPGNNGGGSVKKGDVNGDGKVDVEDVVAIVNKILGDPPANFNERAGDINGDGKIDVDDVVGVVNIILG